MNSLKAKKTIGDRLYLILVYVFILICTIAALYPMIYTLSMSISSAEHIARNDIILFPKGFSLKSYAMVFEDSDVWRGYANTIWYTVMGTVPSVFLTVLSAYPLSRKKFFLRRGLMKFVVITMYFSGGLVPSFILITKLGLYNTRWACILPYLISAWNLIVCRSFFESIPDSLAEAAEIDGASHFRTLFSIYFPLSKPIVAVLALFYAVGQWNAYFAAMMYLTDEKLQPLQMYLRKILILSNMQSSSMSGATMGGFERSMAQQQLQYAVIVVAVLPILAIYPFVQKYFVKGVMVGAVKG